MSNLPIGDYALLPDCHTAALVTQAGSVDWLCIPRFDAPAVATAISLPGQRGCRLRHPLVSVSSPELRGGVARRRRVGTRLCGLENSRYKIAAMTTKSPTGK
jgi:hypothetical protein